MLSRIKKRNINYSTIKLHCDSDNLSCSQLFILKRVFLILTREKRDKTQQHTSYQILNNFRGYSPKDVVFRNEILHQLNIKYQTNII